LNALSPSDSGTNEAQLAELAEELARLQERIQSLAGDADSIRLPDGTFHMLPGAREELQRTERRLERSQLLQRIAGRIGKIGGWAVNLEENQLEWSEEVFHLLSWPDNRTPDLDTALDLFVPVHRRAFVEALEECQRQGTDFMLDAQLRSANGTLRWGRFAGELERHPKGDNWVVGTFQDITEQRQLEQQRRRLAARLERALEQMNDAFFTLDRDWRFTFLNQRAEELLQRGRQELLGQNVWSEFPAAVDSEFERQYTHVADSGESVQFESYYEPLHEWFEVSAHPYEEGLSVYFRPITERKKLQEHLQQAHRLESVGQLTGGVAHDFNNILTVIQGNAEMLREMLTDEQGPGAMVEMICTASERGAELTQRLLAFAGRQPLRPERLDAGALFDGMKRLIETTLVNDQELDLQIQPDLWAVEVDPVQLEKAVLNICINSREAMTDGGTLRISVENIHVDEAFMIGNESLAAGDYVRVELVDDGGGIQAENLPQVFEPFFTTKDKSSGAGLGLSMVYGFVRQSHGHVQIESTPGEGTRVRLYLPRDESAGHDVRPGDAAPGMQQESSSPQKTILVVDDEPMLRAHVQSQLQASGYRVILAETAAEALDLLESSGPVDLLFSDVMMPGGMNGRELAQEARRRIPGLPVLLTSGYNDEFGDDKGGYRLLAKPYRRAELLAQVEQALNQPDRG
jgi:PAS domain S-box-containing protein